MRDRIRKSLADFHLIEDFLGKKREYPGPNGRKELRSLFNRNRGLPLSTIEKVQGKEYENPSARSAFVYRDIRKPIEQMKQKESQFAEALWDVEDIRDLQNELLWEDLTTAVHTRLRAQIRLKEIADSTLGEELHRQIERRDEVQFGDEKVTTEEVVEELLLDALSRIRAEESNDEQTRKELEDTLRTLTGETEAESYFSDCFQAMIAFVYRGCLELPNVDFESVVKEGVNMVECEDERYVEVKISPPKEATKEELKARWKEGTITDEELSLLL